MNPPSDDNIFLAGHITWIVLIILIVALIYVSI